MTADNLAESQTEFLRNSYLQLFDCTKLLCRLSTVIYLSKISDLISEKGDSFFRPNNRNFMIMFYIQIDVSSLGLG
jgi:hypothetical protein